MKTKYDITPIREFYCKYVDKRILNQYPESSLFGRVFCEKGNPLYPGLVEREGDCRLRWHQSDPWHSLLLTSHTQSRRSLGSPSVVLVLFQPLDPVYDASPRSVDGSTRWPRPPENSIHPSNRSSNGQCFSYWGSRSVRTFNVGDSPALTNTPDSVWIK